MPKDPDKQYNLGLGGDGAAQVSRRRCGFRHRGRVRPNSLDENYHLALALVLDGDQQRAHQQLTKVLRIAPNSSRHKTCCCAWRTSGSRLIAASDCPTYTKAGKYGAPRSKLSPWGSVAHARRVIFLVLVFGTRQNLPIDNEPVAAKDLHCCRWIEPASFFPPCNFHGCLAGKKNADDREGTHRGKGVWRCTFTVI